MSLTTNFSFQKHSSIFRSILTFLFYFFCRCQKTKFLFWFDHIKTPPNRDLDEFLHTSKESNSNPSNFRYSRANFVWWSEAKRKEMKTLHNLTLICRPFLVFILINISVWFLFSLFLGFISIRRVFVASRDGIRIRCGSEVLLIQLLMNQICHQEVCRCRCIQKWKREISQKKNISRLFSEIS